MDGIVGPNFEPRPSMDPTAAVTETLELILDLLARDLAELAGLEPPQTVEVDAETRFATLGLDSARATAWLGRLARRLGRPLAPTLLWDHPTPARLAAFLDGVSAPAPLPERHPETPSTREPIAIVGMACRLPGAPDLDELWRRLTETRELVGEVPASRWPIDRFYHPDPSHPGTMSTRRGGFLDQIDRFDAAFFGISPHEARAMDPQQRLLLELGWESLEDAGIVPGTLQGSATGVFVGAMAAEYARRIPRQAFGPFSATGLDTSVLAGRLAYTFGFEGPALSVNTACSSSLVAVHLARRALDAGEVDLALAAGVHLMVLPDGTIAMTKFGGMAPDGRSKAFDARADGYVRAEGGAVVVLERASRALAQGHPIYGLIRGSAVNSDGFSNGLTAPNPAAQEAMLRAALANARVAPETIDYVETHGPGTLLGDPIEAGALGRVLGRGRTPENALRIGSHKPHLGHLEAAAGIVGLVKTTLALRHRTLLPSLNFETPNPNIPFESLGLAVQTEVAPWPNHDRPPRAGVSAFGFSGTNAHVVLEGVDSTPAGGARSTSVAGPRPPLVFVFSGNGSQWLGMGRELLRELPFQRRIARCDQRLAELFPDADLGSLAEFLASPPTENPATTAPGADPLDQLALVATQLGLADLLAAWGLSPDAVVGHSVGEVAAACWSGALDLDDTLRVVYHRSRLQARTAGTGALVVADRAPGLTLDDLERLELGDGVEISAVNGPRSIAVSGDPASLATLVEHWTEMGVECRATPVSIAFHGAAMEPLRAPLAEALADLEPNPPRRPMVSAVDGRWVTGANLDGSFWARHLRQPVRFADAITTLLTDNSWRPTTDTAPVFLEIAPHPILDRPLDQLLTAGPGHRVSLMRRGEALRSTHDTPWLAGLRRLVDLGFAVADEAFAPPAPERCDLARPSSSPIPTPVLSANDASRTWELVPFSAKDPEALSAMVERHGAWLAERRRMGSAVGLRRLAHQRAIRHSHLEHRRVLVACDEETLLDLLRSAVAVSGAGAVQTSGVFSGRRIPGRPPKMVWVFPGQGGQWRGMGRRLLATHPVFRRSLEACDRAVRRHHARGENLSVVTELLEGTDDAIDTVQPVLLSLQVALATTLEHHGLRPGAVVGHSLGEVAASHLAGLLSLDDAAKVICRRSRLLGRIRHRGSMLVTECDAEEARELIAGEDRVALAALNGPRSTVLSGDREILATLAERLSERDIFQRPVRVEVASHSPLVDPLLNDLRDRLADLRPQTSPKNPGRPDFRSTVIDPSAEGHPVQGDPIEGPRLDADYWADNLRHPVRLWPVLADLVDEGYDTVVEVGPHPVLLPAIEDGLRSLGKTDGAEGRFHALGTLRRDEDDGERLASTLGALWAAGADLDWDSLQPTAERHLRLPTYPWQRQRFWIDVPESSDAEPAVRPTAGPHPWLGPGIESSLHPGTWLWQGVLDPDQHPELDHHRLAFDQGFPSPEKRRPVVAAGQWLGMVLVTAREHVSHPRQGRNLPSSSKTSLGLEAVTFREALEIRPGAPVEVQLVFEAPDPNDTWRFQVAAREGSTTPWRVVVEGRVTTHPPSPPPDPAPVGRLRADSGARWTRRDLRRSLARRGIFVEAEVGSEAGGLEEVRWPIGPPGAEGAPSGQGRLRLPIATDRPEEPLATLVGASFEMLLATLPTEPPADRLRWSGPSAADAWAATGLAMFASTAADPKSGDELWAHLEQQPSTGERVAARVTWFDDQGSLVAWFDGLEVERVLPAASRPLDDALYVHRWHRAAPVSREMRSEGPGLWLLIADPEGLSGQRAKEVAGILDRRGLRSRRASPKDPADLAGVDLVLWLASLDLPAAPEADPNHEALGWGGILDLWRELRRSTREGPTDTPPPRILVVTRHRDFDGEPPGALAGHGTAELLAGLLAVARSEAPEHHATWIGLGAAGDSEPRAWQPLLENLVDEGLATLGSKDRELPEDSEAPLRVVLTSDDRWFPERVPLDASRQESVPAAQGSPAHGTWVISGGTGALGLAVAADLAAQGAESLLILARSPPSAAVRRALDGLRPTQVQVEAVDVADRVALDAALDRARGDGPIVGVVHAAGISDDGPLESLDRQRFRSVLAPKVTGAWNLHQATTGDPIVTFLLFGSLGAVLGWPGQGAYAAANAGLAALARQRRDQGLPALAIAWPGWSGLGLAATEGGQAALALLEGQGLASLTGVQGLALNRRWIAEEGLPPEILVIPRLGDSRAAREGDSGEASEVEAEAGKRPSLVEELLATPVGRGRRRAFEDRLRIEVAQVLGLAPADIERDRPWADLGLGSLMALDLRRRLEGLTALSLSTTVVWSQPCLRDLADHLAKRLDLPLDGETRGAERILGEPEPVARTAAQQDAADEDALLDWLDELEL